MKLRIATLVLTLAAAALASPTAQARDVEDRSRLWKLTTCHDVMTWDQPRVCVSAKVRWLDGKRRPHVITAVRPYAEELNRGDTQFTPCGKDFEPKAVTNERVIVYGASPGKRDYRTYWRKSRPNLTDGNACRHQYQKRVKTRTRISWVSFKWHAHLDGHNDENGEMGFRITRSGWECEATPGKSIDACRATLA